MHTASGARLTYDALLLGLGASAHVRFPRALTIDDTRLDELLHGLVEDVDGGYVRSLAFVAPARMALAVADLRARADDQPTARTT